MSDQLSKPLYGQYKFLVDTDRQATLANLGFGATASTANSIVSRIGLGDAGLSPVAASGTIPLDWSLSNVFNLAITGNTTVSFTNLVDKEVTITISVTGTPTITWPAGVKWTAGSAPAVPATGKTGIYKIRRTNGSLLYAYTWGVAF